MDCRKVSWLNASCNASITQEEHAIALQNSTVVPYVIMGAAGFDASNAALVETAFAVKQAHDTAKKAVTDSTKWMEASALFAGLASRPAVPSATESDVVVNKHINPIGVLDAHAKLAAACSVAAMYTDAKFVDSAETMTTMALESHAARPFNVVDHRSVTSAYAVQSCTLALSLAQDAIADGASGVTASEKAKAYQQHAAEAEKWYNLAHPASVPADLKASFEAIKKRLAANYASTYPSILANTHITPVVTMDRK